MPAGRRPIRGALGTLGTATLAVLCCAPGGRLGAAAFVLDPPLGEAPEPFLPLHAGAFSGAAVARSPDPLVAFRWDETVNRSALQVEQEMAWHINIRLVH